MATDDERRRHSRFTIPVVIDAPELSDISLVPEDVSAGGFQVVVTKEPELDREIPCAIQILDEHFTGCRGRVVWIGEMQSAPRAWSVGFRVESAAGGIDVLDKKMKELSERLKG